MERDELAHLYAQLRTLRALGEALGISAGAARNRLLRAGIQISDARGQKRPFERVVTEEEAAKWQRMYDEAGSVAELGRRIGKTGPTALYHLRRAGVDTRRGGFSAPRTVPIATGAGHHNWKGGTYMHSDGYVYQYAPDHPCADSAKGYVLQHRLVMEGKIGRYLTAEELVHHLNEVKTDNRPENLEIMDISTHMSHHKEHFPRDGNGRFTAA